MVTLLVYLLKALVLPPGGNFLLLVAGAIVRRWRPRFGTSLLIIGTASLYACCLPVVGGLLLVPLERIPVISPTQLTAAQAVVVLAAGRDEDAPEYGGDTVDERTLQRVRYGARLARQSGLPVLVSGGTVLPRETRPIADLMAVTMAEEFRITPRWIERRSRNTAENALFSAAILKADGINTIALVSDAAHLLRSRQAFAAAGLKPILAPTNFSAPGPGRRVLDWLPSADGLGMSYYALHEYLGRVYYRVRYGMPIV